jgi:hypothetical protein
MNPVSYRAGLEHGARFKVNNMLQDLLRMPKNWIAMTGDKPVNAPFPEQVFTDRPEDISSLDGLLSAPAPWNNWDNPPGWGYDPLKDRATLVCGSSASALGKTVALANSGCAAVANPDKRAGYFADDTFSEIIHVRF